MEFLNVTLLLGLACTFVHRKEWKQTSYYLLPHVERTELSVINFMSFIWPCSSYWWLTILPYAVLNQFILFYSSLNFQALIPREPPPHHPFISLAMLLSLFLALVTHKSNKSAFFCSSIAICPDHFSTSRLALSVRLLTATPLRLSCCTQSSCLTPILPLVN